LLLLLPLHRHRHSMEGAWQACQFDMQGGMSDMQNIVK